MGLRPIARGCEVQGTIPAGGKAYDNRFCSLITRKNRKIIGWRSYMESLAARPAWQESSGSD